MNRTEIQMLDLLKVMKAKYHVSGVKMEFEAEGTRIEEALRLKEVSLRAGLEMSIKVGGCEAIKDMFESGSIGCDHLVGPMVETPYALKKFIGATRTAFPEDQRENMEFLINVETITTVRNLDAMLDIPEAEDLDGIVIGRVDLTGSMGLDRDSVNGLQVRDIAKECAAKAKARGKKVVVGGAVSADSQAFFRSFPLGHLDRFETRKVVFDCPGAIDNPDEAFLKAVEFELLWLKNKQDFYGAIHHEDDKRLAMLEARYRKSIEQVRGK